MNGKPEEIKTCSKYRRRRCSCKEHCSVRQAALRKGKEVPHDEVREKAKD